MSILDKASLIQIPSGYKSGKLYSIKPDNGDGDFTFSRSSSATRVNSEGLIETAQIVSTTELVVNGDFATDSDWTKGTGWTISGGKANFNGGSGFSIYASQNYITGKTYKFTYDVLNYVSGGVRILFDGQLSQTISSNSVNNTFYHTYNGGNTNIFIQSVGTSQLSIDNVSVKEVIENDIPRLDYSDGSCPSLLLEGQSTNLTQGSNGLTTNWTNYRGTYTANATMSPDGTVNAPLTVWDGSLDSIGFYFTNISFSGSTAYCFSVFLKYYNKDIITLGYTDRASPYLGGGVTFNIANGTVVTVNGDATQGIVEPYKDGWYRCTVVFTTTASPSYNYIDIGAGGGLIAGQGFYVYGAQLEEGSYPTSYIKTTSATATRTADVCTRDGISSLINDSEGVLFAEFSVFDIVSNIKAISLVKSSAPASSSIILYYFGNRIAFDILNPSGTVSVITNITNALQLNKVALKYKSGDIAIWFNGVEIATRTNTISLSGLDELQFDYVSGNGFYGKTKQLIVFDEALSDEELSDLTGQVNLSFNNLATFYGYTIL